MPTVSVRKLNPNGSPSPQNDGHFNCEKDISLWEALESKGHKLPSGCLSGSCSACVITVLAGEENLAPVGPTEASTIERYLKTNSNHSNPKDLEGKVVRLSCQAKVSGDGAIEIAPLN